MTHAEIVLDLCERFSCLPSQVLAEDMEILQLIQIRELGRPHEEGDE